MKKFGIALLIIIGAISYLNAKRSERSRIRDAAEEYTFEACGPNRMCIRRVEKSFSACFEYSYVSLPKPGSSFIDLDLYIDCLNEAGSMPVLELVKTNDALPFPTGG